MSSYLFLDYIRPLFDNYKKEENIKNISVHIPIYTKPIKENDFGHYLAGLIDGDGYINKKGSCISITFNNLDISLAYYIKKRLNYGNVYKIKNKNAVVLIITHIVGIKTIVQLINGKIRTENKFNQLKSMLNQDKFSDFKDNINLSLNDSNNLDNY
jgi:hypothetical protein